MEDCEYWIFFFEGILQDLNSFFIIHLNSFSSFFLHFFFTFFNL